MRYLPLYYCKIILTVQFQYQRQYDMLYPCARMTICNLYRKTWERRVHICQTSTTTIESRNSRVLGRMNMGVGYSQTRCIAARGNEYRTFCLRARRHLRRVGCVLRRSRYIWLRVICWCWVCMCACVCMWVGKRQQFGDFFSPGAG